jgi:aconitase B
MCALAGRIMTVEEYMEQIKAVNAKAAEIYRYMNFDQIPSVPRPQPPSRSLPPMATG